MSHRAYDYECKKCGHTDEHLVSFEERHRKQTCSACGEDSEWVFPVQAALQFQPFNSHYNESLGCDIHSRRELKKILKDKGLIEAGDPVHGARNFDKHAPDHIKPRPTRGIFYHGKERPRQEWDIAVQDKDGKMHKVKESELKTI